MAEQKGSQPQLWQLSRLPACNTPQTLHQDCVTAGGGAGWRGACHQQPVPWATCRLARLRCWRCRRRLHGSTASAHELYPCQSPVGLRCNRNCPVSCCAAIHSMRTDDLLLSCVRCQQRRRYKSCTRRSSWMRQTSPRTSATQTPPLLSHPVPTAGEACSASRCAVARRQGLPV